MKEAGDICGDDADFFEEQALSTSCEADATETTVTNAAPLKVTSTE